MASASSPTHPWPSFAMQSGSFPPPLARHERPAQICAGLFHGRRSDVAFNAGKNEVMSVLLELEQLFGDGNAPKAGGFLGVEMKWRAECDAYHVSSLFVILYLYIINLVYI